MNLEHIALGLGILGLGCFAWPILQRVRGQDPVVPAGRGSNLRSPLWWIGFILTVAAIFLQRIASQQAAGL